MGCTACSKKHSYSDGYINKKANYVPPYNANDISVYENGIIRQFSANDWKPTRHKLLLFYPETNTPVCQSEMGAVDDWVDRFDELNCDIYSVTTDPIGLVKQWYEEEESLRNPRYRALSSFLLPSRIGLMNGGKAKRASVIITNKHDVIIQEHFMKVGRSISELHRNLFGYTTDSYCAEGWQGLESGFLENKNDNN